MAMASSVAFGATDGFNGGFSPSFPWSYNVPGRTPLSSDIGLASFSSSTFDVDMNGFMFQEFNTPSQLANLAFTTEPAGNWEVQTSFKVRWSQLQQNNDPYGSVGIVLLTDVDNYFMFYLGRNGAQNGLVWAYEKAGIWSFGGAAAGFDIVEDGVYTVKMLRLIPFGETQPQYDFFLLKDGIGLGDQGGYQFSLRFDNTPPDAYNYLATLSGKRMGIFTDTAGNADDTASERTVSFDSFSSNLPVSGHRTIVGQIKPEGAPTDPTSYLQTPVGKLATLTLAHGSTVVDTQDAVVDSDGKYVFTSTAPAGSYDVYVKLRPAWLQKKVGTISIGSGTTTLPTVTLKVGDADDDNSVTVFDYGMLSDAFDKAQGDAGYNSAVDFDFDQAVTVFDYGYLSDNFDLSGDAPA